MINSTFKIDPKKWFFDRQMVIEKVGKARVKALSKIGAFIRTRSRRSIRKRKKASEPGNPPHSHTGDLREGILFAYDDSIGGVVVGPRKLNMVAVVDGAFRTGTVPEILEYGGSIGVVEHWVPWIKNKDGTKGGWTRLDLRRRGSKKLAHLAKANPEVVANLARVRRSKIAARPFMRPALAAEITNPKLKAAWENSVR